MTTISDLNTLFDLNQYTSITTPVRDPYWDEIVLDNSGKVEENGQITLFYDAVDEPPEPDDFAVLEDLTTLPEQEKTDYPEQPRTLPEQPKQWVEKYYVTRNGRKHWYFRYCYYQKRIHHIHIPGGNHNSAIVLERKEMIVRAIALGKSPNEIQHFIRGGFGRSGYRLS